MAITKRRPKLLTDRIIGNPLKVQESRFHRLHCLQAEFAGLIWPQKNPQMGHPPTTIRYTQKPSRVATTDRTHPSENPLNGARLDQRSHCRLAISEHLRETVIKKTPAGSFVFAMDRVRHGRHQSRRAITAASAAENICLGLHSVLPPTRKNRACRHSQAAAPEPVDSLIREVERFSSRLAGAER